MQDLGIGSSSTHGSCSPAKFDSGQGSEGSSGDQGELGHGQGLSSPGRVSSSSSQISSDLQMSASRSDLQMSGLQRSGLPPPASKDNCSSLLDTSDESSLDSLELDQVRYILKPKLHKYSHVNNNNNNNSSAVNNKNKNASKGGSVGTKCHITITNNDHSTAAAPPQPPQPPPPPATTTTTTAATAGDESSNSSTRPVLMIDPRCQEIVSGHVTMVTVEGGAVAGQIERLQAEVTRLKVEKLELLRQNVSAQVEKIFHDLKNISLIKIYLCLLNIKNIFLKLKKYLEIMINIFSAR